MKSSEVKNILNILGSRAKQSLGQHFLLDESVAQRMVEFGHIEKEDTIFEIGPGLGILTKKLTQSPAKKIIACEKDKIIFEFLQKQIKQKNLSIINQDALILIPNLKVSSPFKVISNLPYNISSPVIISLLSVCPILPSKMVLMVQKEVAQRLVAKPGDSNRGVLTVFGELFGQISVIENLSPSQFYPSPQVHSSVLLFDNIKMPDIDRKIAFRIIKMAFSKKRKKLKNSLFATIKIPQSEINKLCKKADITSDLRPEDLDKKQWNSLIGSLIDFI